VIAQRLSTDCKLNSIFGIENFFVKNVSCLLLVQDLVSNLLLLILLFLIIFCMFCNMFPSQWYFHGDLHDVVGSDMVWQIPKKAKNILKFQFQELRLRLLKQSQHDPVYNFPSLPKEGIPNTRN